TDFAWAGQPSEATRAQRHSERPDLWRRHASWPGTQTATGHSADMDRASRRRVGETEVDRPRDASLTCGHGRLRSAPASGGPRAEPRAEPRGRGGVAPGPGPRTSEREGALQARHRAR